MYKKAYGPTCYISINLWVKRFINLICVGLLIRKMSRSKIIFTLLILFSLTLISRYRTLKESLYVVKRQTCKPMYNPGLNTTFWAQNNFHDYEYLINNEHVCNDKDVTLLMLVISAPGNFKMRQVARNTWMTVKSYKNMIITHMFLVGYQSNADSATLKKESLIYGDIVQEDFVDSYRNLTLKSIMGLKWASTFCQNAELVFKVDDDIIVNIYSLIVNLISFNVQINDSILCTIIHTGIKNDLLPVRYYHNNKLHKKKWLVTRSQYPDNCYPVYCGGALYAMTPRIAQHLYQMSLRTRYYPVEDVYITGILPALSGVTFNRHWIGDYSGFWIFQNHGEMLVEDLIFVDISSVKRNPLLFYYKAWLAMENQAQQKGANHLKNVT